MLAADWRSGCGALSEEELFASPEEYRAGDLDTKGGRTWAYVYDPGRSDIDRVAKRALVEFYDENALDPTVFPSLLRLENEVVGVSPPTSTRWTSTTPVRSMARNTMYGAGRPIGTSSVHTMASAV